MTPLQRLKLPLLAGSSRSLVVAPVPVPVVLPGDSVLRGKDVDEPVAGEPVMEPLYVPPAPPLPAASAPVLDTAMAVASTIIVSFMAVVLLRCRLTGVA